MSYNLLTEDELTFFKDNKDHITEELLVLLRKCGNEGKQQALDILDFPKDNEKYYLDAFGNRISYMGDRTLKKPHTQLNLSPIHESEIERCMQDFEYYKNNYVKIKTTKGINFPDLRQYQDEFVDMINDEDNEAVVGKIGRQAGKSVTVGIYLSWKYTFAEDMNIGICANKAKLAREFLKNVKNIIKLLPIWMCHGVEVWNKSDIENERETRILTDVPSADAFRGFTIHLLVVDECAHIKTSIWEEFSDAIFPSQSSCAWKKNIIISTPKGMNHFYQLVQNCEYAEDMSLMEVDWRDVPRYDKGGNLLSPEEFRDKVIKKHGLLHFRQNYQCEFLGSSETLIDAKTLSTLSEMTLPDPEKEDKLLVYEYPKKGHKYILSVDPAKDGIDDFSVQIIDVTTLTFKQVASAHLQIDYLLMPEYINEWGLQYNTAHIIIENNEGAGQSIADQLVRSHEYENMYYDYSKNAKGRLVKKKYPGFRTTTKTRKLILQTFKLFLENDQLKLFDKKTIGQIFQFININNKYQADDGYKDDAVMSMAISFAPFIETIHFDEMHELIKQLYSSDSKMGLNDFIDVDGFADF